jgi:hypothetical protein
MRPFRWVWINTCGNPLVWIATLCVGIANAHGASNWLWCIPLIVMLLFAEDREGRQAR